MTIREHLIRVSEEEYGEAYKAHCLEIYKVFVEMADKVSARRQTANSFFLSVNTALVAAIGYVGFGLGKSESHTFNGFVALAGMILCFLWFALILSYKNLNSAKFKVIHEIEQCLPLAPYDAEWETAARGEKPLIYWPFTHIEMLVPWVFFLIHVFVFLRTITQ